MNRWHLLTIDGSAASHADGTAADTHDIRELYPNDYGEITGESLDMYLEAAEQSRKQAHDYANGEAERPDETVWRYWASRDGLTDPAERQAEPVATEPIVEVTPVQEPAETPVETPAEEIAANDGRLPRGANADATTIDPKDLPESGHIANMADAWGEVTRVEIVGQNADGTTRVKVWFKNRPNQRGIDVNVDMGGTPQPPEPPTTPPSEPTGSIDDQRMNQTLTETLGSEPEVDKTAADYMPMENKGGGRMSPNWEKATAEQVVNYLLREDVTDSPRTMMEERVRVAQERVEKIKKERPFKGDARTAQQERKLSTWQNRLDKAEQQLGKMRQAESALREELIARQRARGEEEIRNRQTIAQLTDTVSGHVDEMDLADYVAYQIGTGKSKFKWKDQEKGTGRTHGLGGHLGLSGSSAERKARRSFIDDKNGMWPEEYAELLYANMPEGLRARYSDRDVLNAVLDVMRGASSRVGIMQDLASRWGSGETLEQRIERERDEWERQQEEDMREQQEVDEQMRRNDVAATEGAEAVVDADYADLIVDARARLADPNASEFEKQAARAVLRFRQRDGRGGASAQGTEGDGVRFRVVRDRQEVERLERGKKVKRYRAMQLIDGKLYPPMSARVNGQLREPTELGVWEQADENPELARNGKFRLDKGQKGQGTVDAAYNPYFHTSTSAMNDQFSSAWKRPELVVVEVEIPESELTSGYRAEGAKDSVGDTDWKSGSVNNALPADRQRTVTLSRWMKAVRIVPDAEVADMIARQLDGTDISIPFNVVNENLRNELVKRGVKIGEPEKSNAGRASLAAYEEWEKAAAENDSDAALLQDGLGGEDRQGNRLNSDGTLYVEEVSSIDEITDTDFDEPSRSISLLNIPSNVRIAIGAADKPVIIKKNIFERNSISHSDLTPAQSREILQSALYNPDIYGQNQKTTKPHNWVVINTKDKAGKNRLVLLEVNQNKDNVEIVHWHYIRDNALETLKRQAEREGGRILILPSDSSEEGGDLSARTHGLPSGNKDSDNISTDQTNVAKTTENGGMLERNGQGTIQGLEGYTEDEVLSLVREDIEEKLADAGVDGVRINGMAIHGSRKRGDARSDSDLDVVMEYDGDISEDGLFNLLNDVPLTIEGVEVDINPITEGKSGTLEQYMERSRRYDASKKADSGLRFRVRDEERRPTFFSNAERAVENVKQGKATAEQWKAMLTKTGGIKAGEDKWMGLTDWLDEHKGQSLTKDEVLQFVRANGIRMEERTYQEGVVDPSVPEGVYNDFEDYYNRWTDDDFDTPLDHLEYAWDVYCNVSPRWIRESIEPHLYHDGTWDLRVSDRDILRKHVGINSDYSINRTRLNYTTRGLENKREIAFVVDDIEPYQQYDEIHFGPENEGRAVMWVRFGETRDTDGKRVLVIDEVQSNRHQDAREDGYKSQRTESRNYKFQQAADALTAYRKELEQKYGEFFLSDDLTDAETKRYEELRAKLDEADALPKDEKFYTIPAAPFEKNWMEVAMKRMLRLAAEEGFDKVAWTTGAQQAERYGIGGVVESITKGKTRGENTPVSVQYKNGKHDSWVVAPDGKVVDGGITTGENLSDLIGKELSEKVMSLDENGSISGDGLRIGGEGMSGFYDQIVPSFMRKYVKKWGSQVGDVELATPGGEVMHSVDVTEPMRDSVMQGQPLFRVRRAPNGKESRLDERQYDEVRTDNFKKWFGDWERVEQRDYILSDKYVTSLKGDEFAKTDEPLTDRVAKYYSDNYDGQIERENFGVVILDRRGVKDSISHGIGRTKSAAFAAVPEIIRDGIQIDQQENWKGRNQDSFTFAAPIEIGGKGYVGIVIVTRGKGSQRNRFYLHEVVIQENLQNESIKTGTKAGSHHGDVAKVLKEIATAKNSSKIVDENGEPLVVYHQTNRKQYINRETGQNWDDLDWREREEWDRRSDEEWEAAWEEQDSYTFDNRYARQSVDYPGFFFSPRYDEYHEYGDRTIAAYLDMKNPAIDPDIPNAGVTDTAGRDAMESLMRQGYDGVIRTEDGVPYEYIVFRPEQIKSATENNGDFSRENSDIRFRVRDGHEAAVEDARRRLESDDASEFERQAAMAVIKAYGGGSDDTPDGGGPRFRIREPQKAIEDYERAVNSSGFQVTEALQDSMMGLKKLMQAIVGKDAKGKEKAIQDIAGFENAYLKENRLQSESVAQVDEYRTKYYSPLVKAVSALCPTEAPCVSVAPYPI